MQRVVAILVLALSGCAARRGPDPTSVLIAYAAAVERDDPRAAYALLSERVRDQVSEREFLERWRATQTERRAQAAALRAAAAARRFTTGAQVDSGGRSSLLVLESGGWRVVAPRRTETGARTPEEAVRRFVEALERRDADALLRLLAEPLRSTVERELAERLAKLKATVGKPIPTEGDRARLRYDPRYHLELQRENGQWRVADFN